MPKLPVYNRLFRKRHAHKQHCKKALVKSLKAKLKKALEAIQANEMFDADDADAAESSNIDATSTSTQTATARLEQQTIDFFKIHSPQVNFKDATKNPPNKSATLFPTIVLYCPTFVGGMPMPPLRHQLARNATSKPMLFTPTTSNSRQDPKEKK